MRVTGKRVVPYIARLLEGNRVFWFSALYP
jgi:hypothetical protein